MKKTRRTSIKSIEKRTIGKACLLGLVAALLVDGGLLLGVNLGFGIAELGFYALLFINAPLVGFAVILSLIPPLLRPMRLTAYFLAVFCMPTLAAIPLSSIMQNAALARIAERSNPLIDAINRYEQDHGSSPESLDALVPQYLAELPTTGLPRHSEYIYMITSTDTVSDHYWYDLGSREGKPPKVDRRNAYGDPDHAVLVFEISRAGNVRFMNTNGMPKDVPTREFDPITWKSDPSMRMGMVKSLRKTLNPVGRPFEELRVILGDTDGHQKFRPPGWRLSAHSIAGLGLDFFYYEPGKEYPDYAKRIGDWAYEHD